MTKAESKKIIDDIREKTRAGLVKMGASDWVETSDSIFDLLWMWELAQRKKRRERIATAALQGLLSADNPAIDACWYDKPDEASAAAIRHAAALIAQLDKPETE